MQVFWAWVFLVAFIAILIGLVLLIPLARLKPMRRRARQLIMGGIVMLALGLVAEHKDATAAANPAKSRADAKTFIKAMTDDMDICDTRNGLLEDPTRSGDAVRAYDDAKNAHGVCRTISRQIAERDIPSSMPDGERDAFKKMRDDCAEAYEQRSMAFSDLEDALDSNGQISKLAAFRDSAGGSISAISRCRTEIDAAAVPLGN